MDTPDPANMPHPVTTTAQAIAIARRALDSARPGCAVTLTPRVLSLLLDAATREETPQ